MLDSPPRYPSDLPFTPPSAIDTNNDIPQAASDVEPHVRETETQAAPPQSETNINDGIPKILELLKAMDERYSQTSLNLQQTLNDQLQTLTAMIQRYDDADLTLKPSPPLTAETSSIWNALRKSAYEHVTPKIDQWKATLDTLLVFTALFSAIVTALFIESSKDLKLDEAKRTNDLLANLTDIILIVNGASYPSLGLPMTPQEFVPESQAVRLNSYLFVSLVFSVALAFLAVFSRSNLTSLLQANENHTWQSVTAFWQRWTEAERYLRPAVKAISTLMLIPTFLLILAFPDLLLSSLLALKNPHPLLYIAFGLGCLACFVAFGVVGYFAFLEFFKQNKPQANGRRAVVQRTDSGGGTKSEGSLSVDALDAFHDIVKFSRDDGVLESAASAIAQIILSHPLHDNSGSLPHGTRSPYLTRALRRLTRRGTPNHEDDTEMARLVDTTPRNGAFIQNGDNDDPGTASQTPDRLCGTVSCLLSTDASLRASITVTKALLSIPNETFQSLWKSESGLSASRLLELLERMIFSHGHRSVYEADVLSVLDRALRTECSHLKRAPFPWLEPLPPHIVDGRTFSLFWIACWYELQGADTNLTRKIKTLTFDILNAIDRVDCKGIRYRRFDDQRTVLLPSEPGDFLELFMGVDVNSFSTSSTDQDSDFTYPAWSMQEFHQQTFTFAVRHTSEMAEDGDINAVNSLCRFISDFHEKLDKSVTFDPNSIQDRRLLSRLISLGHVLNNTFITSNRLTEALDRRDTNIPDPIKPLLSIQLWLLRQLNALNERELQLPSGTFRPCEDLIDSTFWCLSTLSTNLNAHEVRFKGSQFSRCMKDYFRLQFKDEKRRPVASTVAARYSFSSVCRIARLLEVYPTMAMYNALPEWVKNPKDHALIYPLNPHWAREYQMDSNVIVRSVFLRETRSEGEYPCAIGELPQEISYVLTGGTYEDACTDRQNELKNSLHRLLHADELDTMTRVQSKSSREIEQFQSNFLDVYNEGPSNISFFE